MFEDAISMYPLIGVLVILNLCTLIISSYSLKKGGLTLNLSVIFYSGVFLLNSYIIGDRWIEAARPPFKTLFETLIFYPWCVGVVTLTLIMLYRLYVLIPFSTLISIGGLLYALSDPDFEIVNLPPALQSVWFVPHVVIYFISYAALFCSFALALLALKFPKEKDCSLWGLSKYYKGFESHAHQSAIFGIVTLTMGLVMGAIWGKVAWGDYWSWDPKENWALVTWLSYMFYLHIRIIPSWAGRKMMWILVIAFCAVIFTYLGMSLLPSSNSLHIYQ